MLEYILKEMYEKFLKVISLTIIIKTLEIRKD